MIKNDIRDTFASMSYHRVPDASLLSSSVKKVKRTKKVTDAKGVLLGDNQ